MSHSTPEEPNLFDLPLGPPPAGGEPEPTGDALEVEAAAPPARERRRRSVRPAPPETLSLFEEGAPQPPRAELRQTGGRPTPLARVPAEPEEEEPDDVALVARLRAAAGDLVVFAAIGAVAAVGSRALGAEIGVAQLAPLAIFVLAWSFLYSVIALAFWGQTPGMAWAGILARGADGEPLSFGQTALRWAGTWLTVALLGLPGLLALTGASLADRLSGSRVYEAAAPAIGPAG